MPVSARATWTRSYLRCRVRAPCLSGGWILAITTSRSVSTGNGSTGSTSGRCVAATRAASSTASTRRTCRWRRAKASQGLSRVRAAAVDAKILFENIILRRNAAHVWAGSSQI